MKNFFYLLRKISYLICVLSIFTISSVKSEEKINAITDQIQIIMQDLKTLEKAVYSEDNIKLKIRGNKDRLQKIISIKN